jgi:hypothetical protein
MKGSVPQGMAALFLFPEKKQKYFCFKNYFFSFNRISTDSFIQWLIPEYASPNPLPLAPDWIDDWFTPFLFQ